MRSIKDTMREATYNWVNEAIALPGSANRPLIYQDPRFALFTQFQGFVATFTANHIPKLWAEYAKRGTPAMKYNAFRYNGGYYDHDGFLIPAHERLHQVRPW